MVASHWLVAIRWYLGVSAAGHLIWEIAHLPLYTLWTTGTPRAIIVAVVHCTVGDLLIASVTLVVALVIAGDQRWPVGRFRSVAALIILSGVGYTWYSEWFNVAAQGAWAYSDLMPTIKLGGFAVGISPLLQWVAVPSLSLSIGRNRALRAGG